jgi:hypothetical protein
MTPRCCLRLFAGIAIVLSLPVAFAQEPIHPSDLPDMPVPNAATVGAQPAPVAQAGTSSSNPEPLKPRFATDPNSHVIVPKDTLLQLRAASQRARVVILGHRRWLGRGRVHAIKEWVGQRASQCRFGAGLICRGDILRGPP